MRKIRLVAAVLTTLALVSAASPAVAADIQPLERAHAHNDYEHDRPLLDALDQGFTSVEADVFLVGGELLVAHDLADVRPGRTLESLYLEPLAERVRANGGSVHPEPADFQLLVDIKNAGAASYLEIHETLRRYQRMLTRFTPRGTHPGAVEVVISGDRPRALMAAQRVRYAAYDGRLSDLEGGAAASFVTLISDNWGNHFDWDGEGPMPADQRARLHAIVARAHADGRRVRFWATPDTPGPARDALWRELLAADVDHINTDDLAGLAAFLREHDPDER